MTLYKITHITSSRTVRVHKLGDSTTAFPSLEGGSNGFSEIGLGFHILELAGPLLFGLKEGTTKFNNGDTFKVLIKSKVLPTGANLKVKYISEADLNVPKDYTGDFIADINNQYGQPSALNTISTGAALANANGAGQVRVFQCRPPTPRKTQATLVEEIKYCASKLKDAEIEKRNSIFFII